LTAAGGRSLQQTGKADTAHPPVMRDARVHRT
jgi:hypothetical protein